MVGEDWDVLEEDSEEAPRESKAMGSQDLSVMEQMQAQMSD
jgi:hypothetical protein